MRTSELEEDRETSVIDTQAFRKPSFPGDRDQAFACSAQSQDTGKQVSRRWARDIIDFACLLAGSFCARWHTRVVATRVPRSRAENAHVLRRSAPVRHALCATTSFIHLRPSARAPVLIDTINGCHDPNTACLSHDSRSSSSYVSPPYAARRASATLDARAAAPTDRPHALTPAHASCAGILEAFGLDRQDAVCLTVPFCTCSTYSYSDPADPMFLNLADCPFIPPPSPHTSLFSHLAVRRDALLELRHNLRRLVCASSLKVIPLALRGLVDDELFSAFQPMSASHPKSLCIVQKGKKNQERTRVRTLTLVGCFRGTLHPITLLK